MPNKSLLVKAVAVAAMLSVGGVAAAATGLRPGSAEQATKQGPADPAGGRSAKGDAAIMINGSDAQAPHGGPARTRPAGQGGAGPDASGPAKKGLCQAWLAGQGDNHGRRADSPAFQALAAAAGGADQVAAYCEAGPDASATHGRRPTTPPNGPRASGTPSTGPPASLDHGQGSPPPTEDD